MVFRLFDFLVVGLLIAIVSLVSVIEIDVQLRIIVLRIYIESCFSFKHHAVAFVFAVSSKQYL